MRRLSLRTRLVVGLIAVAIIGLVTADFVVYQQIRSYFSAQIDQELSQIQPRYIGVSANGTITLPADQQLPNGTYVDVVLANGQSFGTNAPGVHLIIPAATVASLFTQFQGGANPSIFSANATASSTVGGVYRVRPEFLNLPNGPGVQEPAIAFIGVPYETFAGTLNQLILIDFAVTAGVVAVLILLGYFVVRVGLQPLEDIEETAESIAAGDLTQRIEQDDPRTEVGRLGAALNIMLGRIEAAFADQQASEDRLRQFLADASHELRTPVTSIRGYSELFRRGAQNRPEDLALAMRRIEDEAVRMGVLVDDLLLLARLDQGRPLERVPVDLAAIATDAAADAQVIAPDREVTVDATMPVAILGDEQRLRQVVMNLFQNALVHTPPTTPIEVGVRADTTHARISVTDHGQGIAPAHVAHIFERFYRADPSRSRGSGGSGLGLAIVASIAQAHGGEVHYERPEAGGSRFVVVLPLEPTDSELAQAAGDNPTPFVFHAHPAGGEIVSTNGDLQPDRLIAPDSSVAQAVGPDPVGPDPVGPDPVGPDPVGATPGDPVSPT